MKHKIMLLALAATVSLGACCPGVQERPRTATSYHHDTYQRETSVFRGEELGRADVRKVQKSLTREGFYNGPIDGVWGVETSQAILDYQTARHPEQAGVTFDTLQEFGIRMDQDHYDRLHRQYR